MTTRDDISAWFDRGVKQGATHLVVICDTFDWDDYPSYVKPGENVQDLLNKPGNMQRVMEVYNLSKPKEEQLNERRSWNL